MIDHRTIFEAAVVGTICFLAVAWVGGVLILAGHPPEELVVIP